MDDQRGAFTDVGGDLGDGLLELGATRAEDFVVVFVEKLLCVVVFFGLFLRIRQLEKFFQGLVYSVVHCFKLGASFLFMLPDRP